MQTDSLFFPLLRRRHNYKTKTDGEYYSDYREYRQEIREDCLGRCVYCDSHENEVGGLGSMQLDHFRPKTLDEFEHLINDPNNLVLSCGGCNRLKSNHWPARGSLGTVVGQEGFIDPFDQNRQEYFEVTPDGRICPLRPPAQYIIVLLALNRASRKRLRELRHLKFAWIQEFEREIIAFEQLLEELVDLPDDQKKKLSNHAKWLADQRERIQTLMDFDLYY